MEAPIGSDFEGRNRAMLNQAVNRAGMTMQVIGNHPHGQYLTAATRVDLPIIESFALRLTLYVLHNLLPLLGTNHVDLSPFRSLIYWEELSSSTILAAYGCKFKQIAGH